MTVNNDNFITELSTMTDFNKSKFIRAIEDENIRLSLLQYLDNDYYKEEVIKTFTNETLKLEGIKLVKNSSIKAKLISSLQDINILSQGLELLENNWDKVSVIEKVEDEKTRVSLLSQVKGDSYKATIIKKLTDDNLKIQSLSLIEQEFHKTSIILTIKDEQSRYNLLNTLTNDSEKYNIVQTLNLDLQINALNILVSDSNKYRIIQKVEDESKRLSLLKYLNEDNYKEKVINTFTNDTLKLEGIKQVNNSNTKIKLISSLQSIDALSQGLTLLEYDWHKVLVIEKIPDEQTKVTLLSQIKNDSSKATVIKNLTDDNLKIQSLSLIEEDAHKTAIILTIKDEQSRYNALNTFSNESDKIPIISTLTNEQLLYSALNSVKSEHNRTMAIKSLTNDRLKFQCLSLINNESFKATIINSIHDDSIKIDLIKTLTTDSSKMKVIKNIKNEHIKLDLLSILENPENRFKMLIDIKSPELKKSGLKLIDNYQNIMREYFKKGLFKYIYSFDQATLQEMFDENQIKIIEEYKKIENVKIRKIFSHYISSNYQNINIDNLNQVSKIIYMIEMSNSSELQNFGDLIANQVLSSDNPMQQFNKIEDIFVKNNIPYVAKVFEVFKLLHPDKHYYSNYSPILGRFKNSKHSVQIMDIIIFNDLLKCAFGSNNRSLRNFIRDIDLGNNIFTKVVFDNSLLDSLNDMEKQILTKYISSIEIILNSYDKWKNKKDNDISSNDLLIRMNHIIESLTNDTYHEIPDIIIKKICGISGVDSFEQAKAYFNYIIEQTDKKNREVVNKPFLLEEGDFVKGINNINYLSRILQNGSVCKEFLGESSNSDFTPLDTDLARILPQNLQGKNPSSLGEIISSTISGTYGSTWFVLKNDPEKIEITRDSNGLENPHNYSPEFSKLEAFETVHKGHYGIRTGFPTSDISYIVSRSHFDRIGLEIAMNGFYIPVVNEQGQLIFTPEDYDLLRSKMSGLAYYDEYEYNFSENLETEDTIRIANEIEQNNIETIRKRELINQIIQESLTDMGLTVKEEIDGDLTEGFVELIDTGSTGRGTNKPGDGDFDFIMRLDKSIISNPQKLEELKKRILIKLGKDNTTEITSSGDFRLKQVNIDEETSVDIDITFTNKTDKFSYSTDMCIQDRLNTIYSQDKEKYRYVIANILLAKQILKEAGAYKPNRGENPQGGLGGVGIENWILQNGGSFIDASNSFLQASEGRTFEEFKNTYQVWDFGTNHLAEQKGTYPHDNFVSANMNEIGYNNMIIALKNYLNTKKSNKNTTK